MNRIPFILSIALLPVLLPLSGCSNPPTQVINTPPPSPAAVAPSAEDKATEAARAYDTLRERQLEAQEKRRLARLYAQPAPQERESRQVNGNSGGESSQVEESSSGDSSQVEASSGQAASGYISNASPIYNPGSGLSRQEQELQAQSDAYHREKGRQDTSAALQERINHEQAVMSQVPPNLQREVAGELALDQQRLRNMQAP